jgi:hypothetical protein
MRGRFSCVSTSITPSTRNVALALMRAMRHFGDAGCDDAAVCEAIRVEFAGVFRRHSFHGPAQAPESSNSDHINITAAP